MQLFDEAIMLDYHDGPLSGLVRLGGRFAAFDLAWSSEDWSVRAYWLAPISETNYARVWELCAEHEEPRRPFWSPFGSGRIAQSVPEVWFVELRNLSTATEPPFAFAVGTDFPSTTDALFAVDTERWGRLLSLISEGHNPIHELGQEWAQESR
jgi:hypothetical protein